MIVGLIGKAGVQPRWPAHRSSVIIVVAIITGKKQLLSPTFPDLGAHPQQATKSTYIDTPNDRKTYYRLDLQIEHANESGT